MDEESKLELQLLTNSIKIMVEHGVFPKYDIMESYEDKWAAMQTVVRMIVKTVRELDEPDSLRARAGNAERNAALLASFGPRIAGWLAKGNPEPMWYEDFVQAVNAYQESQQPAAQP
jgi:hypothetical protein